mgnify:FL=1
MPSDTHLDAARDLARSEQESVRAKLDAYDEFVARVQDLPVESRSPGQRAAALPAGGAHASGASAGPESACASVRAAFRDTVRPYSVEDLDDDEPLLATIRSELSESIAVALAPTTDAGFTTSLRDAIVAATDSRRAEARAMQAGLADERDQLASASTALDPILTWLVDADETPLTDLGFEDLRARHATLDDHRRRCRRLLADRQVFLDESTKHAGRAGMRHQTLVRYLYADLPVSFPVLSAGVHVEALCADAQRAVRDNLIRRT